MTMAVKSKLPLELIPAEVEYLRLFNLGSGRTHTGNTVKTIGGIEYVVTNNTGEDGLLELLAIALNPYMFLNDDYNEIANNIANINELLGGKASQTELNTTTTIANNAQTTANNALPKTGGAMTGILTAQTNTSYTVAQMRNIILSPNDAVAGSMNNGDIWIRYV